MSKDEIQKIIKLIKQEVVLAMGCTEPVAVALAATRTREILGDLPDRIELNLSKNVFKNAMGVGIPGTGMIGMPIAVAMGIAVGKSSKGLEVLDVNADEVEVAKKWLKENKANFKIKAIPTDDKLFIECICYKGNDVAKAVISGGHKNFVLEQLNDKILYKQEKTETSNSEACIQVPLSVNKIWDFVTNTDIEDLIFLEDTAKYNSKASDEGQKGYGLNTGKIVLEKFDHNTITTIVGNTVAATDARMDGCTLPVFSNSGSGNQGITCTLPVYEYALAIQASDEETIRALTMSHLISIHIKQGIGRLSALCGIVNASIGVACGLTYLKGGKYENICYAIKNMINTLAGMLCDGAKPSCSLKVATGVYAAIVCSELAINEKVVDETDGLSESDVDRSIANLAKIGLSGMDEVDDMVLDIMTNKQ